MKFIAPFLILAIVGLGCVTPSNRPSSSTTGPSRSDSTSQGPQLELLALRGEVGYSYITVEGQVKNISGATMERVQAVVSHYDKGGNFITSDDALIEYDPIMPGQTSPFKVGTRFNPEMETFQVEFKHLMGGTIDTIDTRKKPPAKKGKK